jgi:hypothetical protein
MRRLAAVVVIAAACASARADVTMSKDGVQHETPVAQAAVRVGAALQVNDPKQLDDAARELATATKAFSAWLAAHPRERTAAVARIETAATKLVGATDGLRALIVIGADPAQIHTAAIDALHRYNELIGAHQGEPPPPEVAVPDDLREAIVAMAERIGREVQGAKPDCDKIGAAVMAHVDDDLAVLRRFQAIDDARPQDQREAERVHPDPRGRARLEAALAAMAPLRACRTNATVRAYVERTEL